MKYIAIIGIAIAISADPLLANFIGVLMVIASVPYIQEVK